MIKHRLYRAASLAWKAAGRADPGPGLRVLMYHSVGGSFRDPYGTSISPKLFGAHVEALAAMKPRWELSGFDAPPASGRRLAVTFDDGYRDTLTAAAPLLAARGIPFTVFAIAEGKGDMDAAYLTPSELKELASFPGASVGAHGLTHRALAGLGDADLASELAGSRKRLEDLLGRPVTSMSYPYGSVDRRVRGAAAAAGFTLAGCSRYGLNRPGRDPLLLCRTEVTAWDSVSDLELKVEGHWDWFALRRRDPVTVC